MKLVKFFKPDCVPCQSVSNYLDERNINYEEINPFDNPMLAMEHKIRTVPTLILFDDNNKEIKRVMGYSVEQIDELLELM